MKVTSKKTISFSKINWGINAGESRELPEDKNAQDIILAHSSITKVGGGSVKSENKDKEERESDK